MADRSSSTPRAGVLSQGAPLDLPSTAEDAAPVPPAAKRVRDRYLGYSIDRPDAVKLLRQAGIADPESVLGADRPPRPWWGGVAEFLEPEQEWRLQVRRRLAEEAFKRGDVKTAAYHYLWSQRRFNDAERVVGGLARRPDATGGVLSVLPTLSPKFDGGKTRPFGWREREQYEQEARARLEAEIGGDLETWRSRPWWPQGWR